MPEMHFSVRLPNGATIVCYSPSYIIEEYLTVGQQYPVSEFVSRTRQALNIASERVRERYSWDAVTDEYERLFEKLTTRSAI